jgi:hypothetical protein
LAREYCTSFYGAGQTLFDLSGFPHLFLYIQSFHDTFAIFAVITVAVFRSSEGHYSGMSSDNISRLFLVLEKE